MLGVKKPNRNQSPWWDSQAGNDGEISFVKAARLPLKTAACKRRHFNILIKANGQTLWQSPLQRQECHSKTETSVRLIPGATNPLLMLSFSAKLYTEKQAGFGSMAILSFTEYRTCIPSLAQSLAGSAAEFKTFPKIKPQPSLPPRDDGIRPFREN